LIIRIIYHAVTIIIKLIKTVLLGKFIMLLEINFRIIEYGSSEYKKAIALRERILRKP